MTTTTVIPRWKNAPMYAYISCLFAVLPYNFCILLTCYLLSPRWPLVEVEHDQNRIYSWHSKCSKPLLPTCLDLFLPTLSAFSWIAGRNHAPHCSIFAHGLSSKPTHSMQMGNSRAHVKLFPVPVDRYCMLPQFKLSFDIGCSL